MIVDWAVAKNKFTQNNLDVKPEIKIESTDENEVHNSEITVIDSEDENSELGVESNRYLKIQLVCVSMETSNLYIF